MSIVVLLTVKQLKVSLKLTERKLLNEWYSLARIGLEHKWQPVL